MESVTLTRTDDPSCDGGVRYTLAKPGLLPKPPAVNLPAVRDEQGNYFLVRRVTVVDDTVARLQEAQSLLDFMNPEERKLLGLPDSAKDLTVFAQKEPKAARRMR